MVKPAQALYRKMAKRPEFSPMRKLPLTLQRRIEVKLEGIMLPENLKGKDAFLSELSKVGGMLYSKLYLRGPLARMIRIEQMCLPEALIEKDMEMFFRALDMIIDVSRISSNSSRPMAYLRFLDREGHDPKIFLESVGLFARREELQFMPIPRDKDEIGMRIVSLVEENTDESLRELIVTLNELNLDMVEFPPEERDDTPPPIESILFPLAAYITGQPERVLNALKEVYPEEFLEKYDEVLEEFMPQLEGELDLSGERFEYILNHILQDRLLEVGLYAYPGGGRENLFQVSQRVEFGPRDINGFNFSGAVLSDPRVLIKRSMTAGEAIRNVMILSSESEMLLQHELQHLFDTLISNSSADPVQKEYNSFLAEIAFGPSNDIGKVIMGLLASPLSPRAAERPHKDAAQRILDDLKLGVSVADEGTPHSGYLVGRLMDAIGNRSITKIQRDARNLLNQAYRKAVGITYDQIVEPFSKE
ncbi:MAG: hypothetical protein GY852_05405 [bacterium]|nr:hypothetical protein [bacterium]